MAGRRAQGRHGAHPRVGGEDVSRTVDGLNGVGSPPRRRGRLEESGWGDESFGLTPA